MKIYKSNKPYKLASDVAELIKTLRITPNATTKITPFEAHFGRRPNTPLTNISTSPKLSNLSWEKTKLSCLDEKVLTKPALSAEAMWDRENNSDDELDLVYKETNTRGLGTQKQDQHYLPELTCTPVDSENNETARITASSQGATGTSTKVNPGKQRAKVQPDPRNQQDAITLQSSDDEYDRQLLLKFPIGAHLPLSNKPYDALKLKRSFLMEKSNNLETLRTRKPIRLLINQEKQNLPLVFLKDRFKGPAHTIDPKTGRRIEQIARKSGTIARKTKNPGTFGAQFKIIENGSVQNYSPHTAWIREDGKQPRVVRHDGLAFIPDPRVYGKCRPAALKDFVTYKHLPHAKPRVSGEKTTKPTPATADTQGTISPKRSPPKTTQDVLKQTLNRKALGPQKLLSTFNNKSKLAQRTKQTKTSKPQQRPKPAGKMSPQKKPKNDLSKYQFECDTSISLSSDTDVNENTPSPDKPAAKRIDINATPEQKSPEIRRSSRQRKSALATKFGKAIPIAQIAETSAPCLVAHVDLTTADVNEQDNTNVTPHNSQNPFSETLQSLCSSEEIMCTEIHMETETPEITRNDDLHNITPAEKETSSRYNTTPAEKTTCSRYILDKPKTTEESFSKNFEEAMNILQAISPVRGISMPFQREREEVTDQTASHTAIRLEQNVQSETTNPTEK